MIVNATSSTIGRMALSICSVKNNRIIHRQELQRLITTCMPSQPCGVRKDLIRRHYHNQSFKTRNISSLPLASVTTTGSSRDQYNSYSNNSKIIVGATTAVILGAAIAASNNNSNNTNTALCEAATTTKNSNSSSKDTNEVEVEGESTSRHPEFTAEQVATNNGKDGRPTWMTYAGNVYDVSKFVINHPGGMERILLAAGGPIEPHWHLYRQHFASDIPMKMLEPLVIGTLREIDQEAIDVNMEDLIEKHDDPYINEPTRNETDLTIHSSEPMNAEVKEEVLTKSYLTPSPIYYIRHHHPVPLLSKEQIDDYQLEIDLSELNNGKQKTISLSLDDLKAMPNEDVIMTMQCSGNRRSGFNVIEKTAGTNWGGGAISTAKWTGVRLSKILEDSGMDDPIEAQDKRGIEHVRFESIDGMMVSIPIEKATNPYGDVIVAWSMNDEDLPRDHGLPLRLVVPGYAAVRSLKWLKKITISKEEAEGPWQRGLNYKILPPNVHDANEVNLDEMPGINELSVSSGITTVEPLVQGEQSVVGDIVMMKVKGWSFAGGGRNIVRVDVTGDCAKHDWHTAKLKDGNDQRYGRGWAWTLWEAEVPARVQDDGCVHLFSKGVDMAFNTQPENVVDQWNVRGLINNTWYHKSKMMNVQRKD
jgi:sulfite oxidase